MAENVEPVAAAALEPVTAPTVRPAPGRAERARQSAYRIRFTLVYVLLAVIAAAGITAFVVVLTRPDVASAPRWSAFVPTGSPVAMVRQIATQVSSEYHLADGSQIVTVIPGPLEATRFLQTDSGPISVEVPITTVAVQPDVSTGKHEEGDYTTFDAGSTVAYQMCGFGSTQQNCSITSGKPSVKRGRLLRREALELALYTLKYVPGTDAVLTYLPPPNSQAPPTSVLLARKDVAENLDRPLTRTLTPQKVKLGESLPEATTSEKITLPHLYTYDYQTLPGDGTAVLVLTAAITGR